MKIKVNVALWNQNGYTDNIYPDLETLLERLVNESNIIINPNCTVSPSVGGKRLKVDTYHLDSTKGTMYEGSYDMMLTYFLR